MAGENINRKLNIYINDKEVVNSLSGITREMGKTRNELKNLNKNADDYEAEVKRLTKHLDDLNEKQTEFKDELKLTNKEMGAAKENFSNLLSGIASGDMKAIQAGLLGIRGSIVATSQAALAFLLTPVGAFVAVFAGLGLATKEVVDFNESIKESNQLLDNLGVDQKLRPAIQGIADTYKVGFETIAKSIDDMVDLKLVKNEFEALDKIKEGLVKAPDKNAFLEMLGANGIAAKNLGLQLDDIISLNESFEGTAANAEAIFGALQKSSSTLILQSPQLKKSMESALGGAFTSELLGQVKAGSITYYEALDKIYVKGEEMGISNQKQAQLAKDLFGKSAIAAGGYEMILGNVAAAHDKNTQALTETQIETQKLANSNIELAKAEDEALKLDGYNRWKNNAILALNSVKKAWYNMISGIVNNEDDIKKNAQVVGEANRLKDEQKNFSDYMALRQKRLGKNFDWEKERAEHLADVVKRMNDSWKTPEDQKSFDLQISVIKKSKNPTPKKQTPDGIPEDEQKAADKATKSREKAIDDAKKHSEALKKELETSQKELLATQRAGQDAEFAGQKESYEKELGLLNTEYDRKIEDTKLKVAALQEEIGKLNSDAKDPKNSKSDNDAIKATIAAKIAAQKEYTSSLVSIEQARGLKMGALQEKYLEKSFQKEQEEHAKSLLLLKTKQNFELAEVTSLAQAKGILAKSLSSDELSKITTLEKAKKAIKEQNLKEQYALEMANLNKIIASYESAINNDKSGLVLLSDEERDKLLTALDQAKAKIAEIKGAGSADAKATDVVAATGVDILGYDAAAWENTFNNLDTFQGKIDAIKMVAGALTNAFGGYFKALEAGEARTLQKFQNSADKKKRSLADQLEKGAISQEVYNAKVAKIDADIARKKAEIEYKQAKRQKAMAIVNAIVNTAVGIMQAYAQLGPIGGTIAAVLIGAMGALEVATISKQPLPDKSGFYDGGYTGDGNPSSESTALGNKNYTYHKGEYVVPNKVLFSNDPVVPNIVGYLEAKRTGKQPMNPQDETSSSSTSSQSGSGSSQNNSILNTLIQRLSAILEKIEEEGIQSYLVNDYKTAKKMRDKIKEVTKNETNAKP
ncbi:MAG: hypothetical protein H7Y10_12345 [Flavobacterium sp.]|nr:hypothetical protein [Flavobacterium sp.]